MTNEQEVLFNQLSAYRTDILTAVEGISREQAEIVPEHFNNNIRWNLGHIYLDQFLWIEALTKEASEATRQFNQWFGFGTSPENFTSETPTFEKLVSLLREQPNVIKKQYKDRLTEEFEPIDMGMYTIEQVLIRTVFHEGMHLQAIIDIRKCIG
ncbi:DinB family protein [Oceanobacillus sp. CFH 90083]|uniref:DinB family protein n=1 Tax=Oceanobacillus sp. CFH 90083 TaxID=2592336 RepID=UPI00128D20CB|nr:DinB family protein [Oceanobacillus sp. CFH 90083]